MFKFENVTKSFKTDFWAKPFVALDDVSFSLNPGNIVGFLGANGAGKTTGIKSLLGFINPTSGQISFDPLLGKTKKEIFRNIGYLPERPYFYPDLTGNEFLHYIGKLNDLSNQELKVSIEKWASKLKIDFALDRRLRFYSKGMLQRVGFVSALIHNPKLLVLDEPLSGLDPLGRHDFKDIMNIVASEGKTIFFSSHILSDVEEVCEDVVILQNGKLIYSGNIFQLISDKTTNDFEVILRNKEQHFVKESELSETLKSFLSSNQDVESVRRATPTLEEIIYEVNS